MELKALQIKDQMASWISQDFLKFTSRQRDIRTAATQAGKRYKQFIGAISNKNTKKGVFITTAKFTKEAQTFAKDSQNFSVVLIDGNRLAELMIKYKVGVQIGQIYEICKIDTDFFDENNFQLPNKQSFAFYHINFTVHNTNKPKFYQLKTLFKPNFTLINAV